jgi:hypothetical protein
METEVREHLNLAHYNFNHMAVIDEEGQENGANAPSGGTKSRGTTDIMSAG